MRSLLEEIGPRGDFLCQVASVCYKYMYLARQPEIEQTKGTTGGNVCVGTKVSTSDSRYSDSLRWG